VRHGLRTAADFANQTEGWVRQHCAKPLYELWQELNGHSIWEVITAVKESYQSISKTKTFTPPSADPQYVFAQLSKNIENACIKARRYRLGTLKLSVFLKTQQFRYTSLELKFNRRTAWPAEIIAVAKTNFQQLYRPDTLYRATGVVLFDLQPLHQIQMNLFEGPLRLEKLQRVYASVDQLAQRYGKHTVKQASSLGVAAYYDARVAERKAAQTANTQRQTTHQRQFVGLPMLNMKLT
jgi:DNA polymerase-4/DNA polymerase V